MWRPSSDSTEAAEHRRMAEEQADFTSIAPSVFEIFVAVAVVLLAIALLVLWGPEAIEGIGHALSEAWR